MVKADTFRIHELCRAYGGIANAIFLQIRNMLIVLVGRGESREGQQNECQKLHVDFIKVGA
jgi:hypothetical protein